MLNDADFKAAKEIAFSNKARSKSLFEEFKREQHLPSDALIYDVSCQRMLKVGVNDGDIYFKPYYGLTIAISLPPKIADQVCKISNHLKRQLSEHSVSDSFLFLPKNTYHVTLLGLVERPFLKIDAEEAAYYAEVLKRLDRSFEFKENLEFTISIGQLVLLEGSVIYCSIKFDREPNKTLSLLNSEFGKGNLNTGYYHLTICYQSRTISTKSLKVVQSILTEVSQTLIKKSLNFRATKVELLQFSSMEKYERVGDSFIHLSQGDSTGE